MRLLIERLGDGETIATVKDFKDIKHRGEISHILAELEIIKGQLLNLWVNFDNEEYGHVPEE